VTRRGRGGGGISTKEDPLEIAKARYARGEITKEESEQIKRDLPLPQLSDEALSRGGRAGSVKSENLGFQPPEENGRADARLAQPFLVSFPRVPTPSRQSAEIWVMAPEL
jgi:hypothetical protein